MCTYTLQTYTCTHTSKKGISWCEEAWSQRSFGLCRAAKRKNDVCRHDRECDFCLLVRCYEEKVQERERRREEGRQ
jgi:hypothetical protein